MDQNIEITIIGRVATAPADAEIICGNSDYTVTFIFDDEWEGVEVKTALFKYSAYSGPKYHIDVPFTGNVVEVPILTNAHKVEVGVYAGNLTTTTGATIRCVPSIRCGVGEKVEPNPDKYDQLMELIKGGVGGGGIEEETDPTVPDWAKKPKKPIYSAEEIAYSNPEAGFEDSTVADMVDAAVGVINRDLPALREVAHEHANKQILDNIDDLFVRKADLERPTASMVLLDGDLIAFPYYEYTLPLITWEEILPVGTEIKTIKIKYNGTWIDIHELNSLDNVPYALNMNKIYFDEYDSGGYVFALIGRVGSAWGVIVESLFAGDTPDMEVIYYTDGGEE